jgi:hypothetical protein
MYQVAFLFHLEPHAPENFDQQHCPTGAASDVGGTALEIKCRVIVVDHRPTVGIDGGKVVTQREFKFR